MNERLNTQDIANLLADKHGMNKKDADEFVKEFFLLIEQALESDRNVKIRGLGTFKLIDVDSRESVNVNTGDRIQIQKHTKVSFVPDTILRDVVNKPFAHFETVVLNENTVLEDVPTDEPEEEDILVAEDLATESQTTIEEPPIAEEQLVVEEPVVVVIEPVVDQQQMAIKEPITEQLVAEPDLKKIEPVIIEQEIPAEILPETVLEQKPTAEEIIAAELQKSQSVTKNMTSKRKKEVSSMVENERDKSPVPYLVILIVSVLLLCCGAVFYVYYPDFFSSEDKKDEFQMPVPQPVVVQPKASLDTIVAVKDTVTKIIPDIKRTPVSTKSAPVVRSDSAGYKIAGTKATYTVQEGETLTRISLRFYGAKAFWPYIVQHNQSIIKNPNSVPYGTVLKIPELVKK